jgi:hypothetical protein
LCDMKSLEALVKSAECCPDLLRLVVGQTGKEMIAYCKLDKLSRVPSLYTAGCS